MSVEMESKQPPGRPIRHRDWTDPLACYYLTSAIAFLGVLVGFTVLKPGRSIPYGESSYLKRCAAWDGGQFMQIIEHGYQYDPDKISNVAMFPAFPFLGGMVSSLTGLSSAASLLIVANTFLAATFLLLYQYVKERFPDQRQMAIWTTLAFGLFPVTFFFRMAYSESIFLFLCVFVFLGFQRGWPLPVLALMIGATMAVRVVGIALIVPMLMQILRREKLLVDRLAIMALTLPLCTWGLLAYMAFLWQKFDDPLVFVRAQENFLLRPPIPTADKLWALVIGEPIWGTYLPSSNAFWRISSREPAAWLNLQFANPMYFLVAIVMLIIGFRKRILNNEEAVITALLLVIPYITRGYDFSMGSQARYAAAAFPLYLVWGAWLSRWPLMISGSLMALWGFLLAMYSALFAAWYFMV